MDRIQIEIKLNQDRAWRLEHLAAMDEADIYEGRTQSADDPESTWSFADHFIHPTLIEKNWNAMFRRHLDGGKGMNQFDSADGSRKSIEDIMAWVNHWTEEWKVENAGKPIDELVRIGQEVRADTLALLASLTDEQLASKIPGAPWSDGTVGGIMAANADHGKMHWGYAVEGDEHA